jgi:hypothetical protein
MENVFSILISAIVVVSMTIALFKYVKKFKSQSVRVEAKVMESVELDFNDSDTYKIRVLYTYESLDFETVFSFYGFKQPGKNDKIKIRINPDQPSDAGYYGQRDKLFYFVSVVSFIVLTAFATYLFYSCHRR